MSSGAASSSPQRVASPPPGAPPSEEAGKDMPSTVYDLIHALFAAINDAIDQPLAWDALIAPSINFTIVRPIVKRFTPKPTKEDVAEDASNSLGAVIYAIMACRIQFLRLVDADLSQAAVMGTRADFCELLAIKILRAWPEAANEVALTEELVRVWGALDGAPEDVRSAVQDDDLEQARDSAMELAIVSDAKRLLAQPLIQHLIDNIYSGELVWQPQTSHSLIADNFISAKTRRRHLQQRGRETTPLLDEYDPESASVYLYNPYRAGWLDYTRLRVPRWRGWIEFVSFAILLGLFVATLSTRDLKAVTGVEVLFVIYTFGVLLDEFASARENGWLVYVANAWNMFDISFLAIFLSYLTIRIIGLVRHSSRTADYAFDILALAACILFPRMVFFLINSSVVLIALREMIATYINFMLLTAVAFSGICFCLWELGRPQGFTMGHTAKLLFKIWFGTGSMSEGELYHPEFGPPILFVYNALCKTFLITMMMSMISQKYGRVYSNAQNEYLFQHVVATLDGVKSDSVFSYFPGFNLIALAVLVPLSNVASPEQLHRVNVFLIRVCNFPILFAISAYERWRYRTTRRRIRLAERGQSHEAKRGGGILDSFLGSNSEVLIHAAFEISPPNIETPSPSQLIEDPEAAAADTTAAKKPQVRREKTGGLGKLFKSQASTVTVSAEEWNEVRESQRRLEELLTKVAAVSGV